MIVRTPRFAIVLAPVSSVTMGVAAPARVRRTPTLPDRRAPRGRLVDVYA